MLIGCESAAGDAMPSQKSKDPALVTQGLLKVGEASRLLNNAILHHITEPVNGDHFSGRERLACAALQGLDDVC